MAKVKTIAVDRRTRRRTFSAHGAQWEATITRGPLGEVVYLLVRPACDETGCYPARLLGPLAALDSICTMINALLVDHQAGSIAKTLGAILTAAGGEGLVTVRPYYRELLPQIIRVLEMDEA